MQIIGIAGGTASGKTTFSEVLENKFANLGKRVRTIHMDGFFKPEDLRPKIESHISNKLYIDDNCPETIDWTKLYQKIEATISSSQFDIIIIEGLLVLWDVNIKNKLSLKVYVDCKSDERIVRRIKRNMKWGQSFDQITNVYLDMVRFRHDQYVEHTKWSADIVVNGSCNTDIVSDMICKYVIS